MTLKSIFIPLILLSASSFIPRDVASDELGIVRIKAELSDIATAYFTGTHIGDGLILTCGHCCESKRRDVEVRILSERDQTWSRNVRGVIVCYDHDADVGLIQLERNHGLRAAYQLAPRGFRLYRGDEVVACDWRDFNDQEQLYAVNSRITGINLYMAPDNIETTSMPRDGASGGPLFMRHSRRIIGVTTAANIDDRRGIHTGLEPIYRLLEQCRGGW